MFYSYFCGVLYPFQHFQNTLEMRCLLLNQEMSTQHMQPSHCAYVRKKDVVTKKYLKMPIAGATEGYDGIVGQPRLGTAKTVPVHGECQGKQRDKSRNCHARLGDDFGRQPRYDVTGPCMPMPATNGSVGSH
jgi:hypothetical protein